MIDGNNIYCDCCGNEKMGEIIADKLVVMIKRHGEKHIATVNILEILDILRIKANNNFNISKVDEVL